MSIISPTIVNVNEQFTLSYSNPSQVSFNAGQSSNDNYSLMNKETPISSNYNLSPSVTPNPNFILCSINTFGQSTPTGIACDDNNNIYVSYAVVTVSTSTYIMVYNTLTTNIVKEILVANTILNLQGMRYYNGFLYVACATNGTVYQVNINTNTSLSYIYTGNNNDTLIDLTINQSYIAIYYYNLTTLTIVIYDNNQNVIQQIPITYISGYLNASIEFDSYNNLYVSYGYAVSVFWYNEETVSWSAIVPIISYNFTYPYRILIDDQNNLYVSYSTSPTTTYLTKYPYLNIGAYSVNYSTNNSYNYFQSSSSIYQSIAINSLGQIFVIDSNAGSIIQTIIPNKITFSNVVFTTPGLYQLTIQDTTINQLVQNVSFTINVIKKYNQKITIKVHPNPIVANEPATIDYYNAGYLPEAGNQYYLKNQLGQKVSNIYTSVVGDVEFAFTNVVLTAGLNILSIYNKTTDISGPTFSENVIKIDVSTVCFKEGTKILCYAKPKDRYFPIEELTDNLFIKTYKHGYKKIKYILKSRLINSSERTMNKLYVIKKTTLNGLTEDLYITGSHAVLKDRLSMKEESQMDKLLTAFKDIDYNRKIDGMHKLVACFDDRFQEYNEEGIFNIYHLVLENDSVFQNYGIYANGLLTESTDELTLHRMTDFDIVCRKYLKTDHTKKDIIILKHQVCKTYKKKNIVNQTSKKH